VPDLLTVRQALAQAGLAPVDARALLAHVLKRDRAWLIAHATDALAREDLEQFFALARRRRDGEPVAYLTGEREFWGLTLAVDRSVLIPRPETETLVECALRVLLRERPTRVLDLGTGTGAIAIALAIERPQAQIVATDASPAAIAIARANVARMKLERVRVIQSSWYEALPGADARFDVIASNPPYVALGDPHLSEGDLRFEPRGALCAGRDGLDALRIIVAGARERLAPQGHLVVEHGYDQAEAVRALVAAAGLRFVESARDLAGIPRVAVARAP
jgi:release factor glutamine methyltransferase